MGVGRIDIGEGNLEARNVSNPLSPSTAHLFHNVTKQHHLGDKPVNMTAYEGYFTHKPEYVLNLQMINIYDAHIYQHCGRTPRRNSRGVFRLTLLYNPAIRATYSLASIGSHVLYLHPLFSLPLMLSTLSSHGPTPTGLSYMPRAVCVCVCS